MKQIKKSVRFQGCAKPQNPSYGFMLLDDGRFLLFDYDAEVMVHGSDDEIEEYLRNKGEHSRLFLRMLAEATGEYPQIEELGVAWFTRTFGALATMKALEQCSAADREMAFADR